MEIRRGPPLHPDDITSIEQLRAAFARARELGLLDEVIEEFCG